MKTDGNDTAYTAGAMSNYEETNPVGGLTKREYFAAMAMQGLISTHKDADGISYFGVASEAVHFAQALIKALNEGKKDAK